MHRVKFKHNIEINGAWNMTKQEVSWLSTMSLTTSSCYRQKFSQLRNAKMYGFRLGVQRHYFEVAINDAHAPHAPSSFNRNYNLKHAWFPNEFVSAIKHYFHVLLPLSILLSDLIYINYLLYMYLTLWFFGSLWLAIGTTCAWQCGTLLALKNFACVFDSRNQ